MDTSPQLGIGQEMDSSPQLGNIILLSEETDSPFKSIWALEWAGSPLYLFQKKSWPGIDSAELPF